MVATPPNEAMKLTRSAMARSDEAAEQPAADEVPRRQDSAALAADPGCSADSGDEEGR
jgi:hypothetical protein